MRQHHTRFAQRLRSALPHGRRSTTPRDAGAARPEGATDPGARFASRLRAALPDRRA
ncbi:hypothetical protein [Nocardioides caldifontis]|uniref:hypothetical protein n=1 Tax=Nocardioides caldifontis TaxID=2588938 RepID=UPI001396CCB9|nr:hypothetical protein [Nocardioides caldifontis]